jgi:hypothetical protein
MSVIDFEARRKARRKKMFLIGALPSLLVLLVTLKLLSVPILSGIGLNYYRQGNGPAAVTSYGLLEFANFRETYKVFFNKGTSLIIAGEHEQAQVVFEDILPYVDQDLNCPVRVNLAIAVERQADQKRTAKQYDEAITLYSYAIETVTNGGCAEPKTDSQPEPTQTAKDKASQAADRLTDKTDLTKQERNNDAEDPAKSDDPQQQPEVIEGLLDQRLEKLAEENQRSAAERSREQRQYEWMYGDDNDNLGHYNKPW